MENREIGKENEMETKEGGMWQLSSTRSQIYGYANRLCYCPIAIRGPTNPPVASPLFPSLSSIYFPLKFSHQPSISSSSPSPKHWPKTKTKKIDIEITERSSNSIEYEMMVGLSIVLEGQKGKKIPQVINKTTMLVINKPSSFLPNSTSNSSQIHPNFSFSHPPPFMTPTFLDQCFLCKQKLLPGKDIYMYKGDRGFCSVECRYRQIFMDEEETFRQEKHCSMAASSSSSSSSSSAAANQRRGAASRNRAGGFAY